MSIQIVAVVLSIAGQAAAQDSFREVDLDGQAPLERVYASGEGFRVLIWNAAREEWIDVFRASGDADALDVGRVRNGALADLTLGTQTWGWRGSNYLPLPQPPADASQPPGDIARIAYEAVGSRASPDSASGFGFSEPDGSTSWFVVVNDPANCSSWQCPGVVVRNGAAARDIGAIIGDLIGPSQSVNAQGHRRIEQVKDGELLVMDPDDVNADTEIIPGIAVEIAAPQPDRPKERG